MLERNTFNDTLLKINEQPRMRKKISLTDSKLPFPLFHNHKIISIPRVESINRQDPFFLNTLNTCRTILLSISTIYSDGIFKMAFDRSQIVCTSHVLLSTTIELTSKCNSQQQLYLFCEDENLNSIRELNPGFRANTDFGISTHP